MELQQINNIIAQAKEQLNAAEGIASGRVGDARNIFITRLAEIIQQQNAEIEQLKKERATVKKTEKVKKPAN